MNIPVQKSSISPISRSQTGTYNLLTSSKISTNDTSFRPTNNEVVANNDNKMKEDTEFGEQLQNSSENTISDSTVRNEPSSTMNQILDKSKKVSIETTKGSIVISIKFFRHENGIAVSQTKDDSSFCECLLVKSFNNFLGMFKDIFVEMCGLQHASKNPAPRIRITDHSRILNDSRDETLYMMLPTNANRSVGNK